MLFAMLHEISVVSAVTGPPGPKIGVGLHAVAFEHDLATVQHQHRQADTVRGIGGEQLVGDSRKIVSFTMTHRIEIGSNGSFRSERHHCYNMVHGTES